MPELNEGIISRTLWIKYGRSHITCPNIYAYAFESDLLILRKSGTVVEYEIKLPVQDFKAGLKKQTVLNKHNKKVPYNYHRMPGYDKYTRHEYLLSGQGANMFYYVMPEEVAKKVDIPDWAGLIHVRPRWSDRCVVNVIKKAPFLHKNKPPEKLKEKLLTSCYYKFWQHYAIKQINKK
jgi:hypothetical protein